MRSVAPRHSLIPPPRHAAALFGLLAGLVAGSAGRAAIPPDLPMVQRLGTGVRALGMGGASTALSDDAYGLAGNPAGLARIRTLEFSGSVQSRSLDTRTTYLGNGETTPADKSRIHALGFAYPFPTLRGSLVIGFSYDRAADFDQEYFRRGAGGSIAEEEESMLEEGGLGAWRAGVAVDVSPNLALGANGTILAGSSHRERSFRYRRAGGTDREATSSVVDLDLTAVSGTLGALYRSETGFRLGLALHLPESFDADGRASEDVRRYEAAGDTLDYVDTYDFKDEFQLPFRTSIGVAYAPRVRDRNLVLSAQWDYADWQQIEYDGPLRLDDRTYAYRATHDLRFGAEYRFRPVPVELRVGYIRQPVAYHLVGTNVFLGEAKVASFDPDRSYFTFGATVQLDPTFLLEMAYVTGTFERSASSTAPSSRGNRTTEKVEDRRLLFGATFQL